MGTRADFYVGRGANAEWVGSIAWDGYPDGIPDAVKQATTPETFATALAEFFKDRDDVTLPAKGWPWPWNDSQTTDWAYALDEGKAWASCFGSAWHEAAGERPDDDGLAGKVAVFPDMSKRRDMAEPGSTRSGVMMLTLR